MNVAVVTAPGEVPAFRPGSRVRVARRWPLGHYRLPQYLRGRAGIVECVIEPRAVDNEEEGYGRNAGCRLHYYRIAFAMSEVWPVYSGPYDGYCAMNGSEDLVKRLPNDIGGLPGPPIMQTDHPLQPWEKRCGVEALGKEIITHLSYYERWIVAFTNILYRKNILVPSDVARKMSEIEARLGAPQPPHDGQ